MVKNILIGVLVSVVVAGGYFLYVGQQHTRDSEKKQNISNQFEQTKSDEASTLSQKDQEKSGSPSYKNESDTIASEKPISSLQLPIFELDSNQSADTYNLFRNPNEYVFTHVKYIEDSIISSGKYAGYHRLVTVFTSNDMMGILVNVFATKDYRTFVLDRTDKIYYVTDTTGKIEVGSAQADYNDVNYNVFNKEKVVSVDDLGIRW